MGDLSSLALPDSPEPTDSERIDWLQFQGCVELTLNKSGQRPQFYTVDQGERELARGASLREAIDRAIAGSSRREE